ncbi:MAG: methionine--tRNA ligase [Rickettsiales bacterium]|nr:methionine--tRNA ligase [Rickettsiales bacterium]
MNKIYITTPIFYVNDKPHIGHAYTSIICDVLSRFYRLDNFEVKFLTGTDEHGQKIEKAAKDCSMHPNDFVDKISKNFLKLTKTLNLSNNDFIRTTEVRHKKAVISLWNKLLKNKYIYLGKYEGWYSVKDESFYQEKELKKVNNKFFTPDGGKVEWIKEESYFFKLSEFEKKLLKHYQDNGDFIRPVSRKNEVVSFVKKGLKDLSISRNSFQWGINVPNSKEHIIYVWIDALTNYLTSLEYPNEKKKFLSFWNNSIHVIGKDILKFHAIYWPAILMAADLKIPKQIFAHGWWTNEGEKISKSFGNTIDPVYLIDRFGLDQLRYYLLREVPLGNDGDFSEKSFILRTNSDLSNSLGNLLQRTLKFSNKHFDGKFPCNIESNNKEFLDILNNGYQLSNSLKVNIKNFEIHKALEKIWKFINKLNKFIDDMEPWNKIKNQKEQTAKVMAILIESIRIIGIVLQPFLPNSSQKILDILNVNPKERTFKYLNKKNSLVKNSKINDPEQLFPRINV